jgi:hypothetical protein
MVAINHPASIRLATSSRWETPSVYRRRRAAVAGLLLVALALASLALQLLGGSDGGHAAAHPVARVSVVVAPGDSVWSIASDLAPTSDPRPVVDAIVAANGGSSLVPGQRLDLVLP